jgi:hypothetical protein
MAPQGWAPAECGAHARLRPNVPIHLTRLAAPNAFVYTSNNTGQTYTLNTSFVSQADAERQCACTGGHLVSFTAQEEQQDVGSPARCSCVQWLPAMPRRLVCVGGGEGAPLWMATPTDLGRGRSYPRREGSSIYKACGAPQS